MRERLLAAEKVKSIDWREGRLYLLDQRRLPQESVWHCYDTATGVVQAIRSLVVRGASAIGISAAYAVVLGLRARLEAGGDWRGALEEDFHHLEASRSTAANLHWALRQMRERLDRCRPGESPLLALERQAIEIHQSDREANLVIAQLGLEAIRKYQGHAQNLLTHGNAGALASGGFGTALGVVRAASQEELVECVYVDETRPRLQGSRLTAWELEVERIPVLLNADAAAAHLMKVRGVTWVIVGADRIAANGDVVSQIGTYQLAVLAMHHGVRFMVAAPSSSIDMTLETAELLDLEERGDDELLEFDGQRMALGVEVFNPAFDVTPADLIDLIVTEKGIVERPTSEKMAALMSRKHLH
ncbi:S-methyl-5-thioribose-1-phosphate isomerase [Stutzerimonas kirkiae]|uniref:S-methyl-5-thioribose-1-phosphate isomerase n=1 Tax=Stutzerimonas kirkiae TaxID=2211392 RepID=UPI0010384634|nr:S-methyl-5-thioribose-1-phosphate isomerase [Stutzerimonas kirkiae]TBV11378.1 S-methyl-5-thioribose-1-phosphate isomerase [Stutzerimonas kirkiae]TBV12486.1 S-methyl-5-thioribose-1-phosphate isomerase [Stutzerimonas kirkiae]